MRTTSILLLAAALFSLSQAATAHACGDAPLLVRVTLQPGELRTSDWPSIAVHANGCAALHRPAWYRDSGDFVLRVSPQELVRFVADARDIARLDPQLMDRQRDALADARARLVADGESVELYAVEGADISRFEMGGEQSIAWTALEHDAARYGEVPGLATLRDVQRALVALLYDARAERAP